MLRIFFRILPLSVFVGVSVSLIALGVATLLTGERVSLLGHLASWYLSLCWLIGSELEHLESKEVKQ